MYKTRNTGTGNGMRGMRGMWGMLYSGECRQTFRGMYSNIPGNAAKHSEECRQTFRGMSPNVPGNFLTYLGECWQVFREMPPNIPVSSGILGNACITQGDEDAGSVQDFMKFVVQNIAWNV